MSSTNVSMGMFQLNSVSVNGQNMSSPIKPNYYANDDVFSQAKAKTAETPQVYGETTEVDVTDQNSSMRDLQVRDILAKYIGGVSGYKQIMGSDLEAAFIAANKEDFVKTGEAKRDGKQFDVYNFNAATSDNKLTMPTLQINPRTGEEMYVLGDKCFTKEGKEIKTETKYGDGSTTFNHPDGSSETWYHDIYNAIYSTVNTFFDKDGNKIVKDTYYTEDGEPIVTTQKYAPDGKEI